MSPWYSGVYPRVVSTRFSVTALGGDPPLVAKRGDAAAIGREVTALGILAGHPWVPRLVAREPGCMITTRMPGAPRALAEIAAPQAGLLGARLREMHETRRSPRGWLWWWPQSATSLADYRRARAEDAERTLAGGPDAGLARRALALALPGAADPHPFRLLHGDLVEANIVWGPDGPSLVDWEFWRLGDPAEDLAYLVEINGMTDALTAALLQGYAQQGMAARVDAWRTLVAVDAGAWYLAEGLANEGEGLLMRARGA